MKAILKYDYEWTEIDDQYEKILFNKDTEYNVVAIIKSNKYIGEECVVIVNENGESMSVSSNNRYVTLIEDNQELITKLRYDGIEHVDISKQGE